MTPYEKHQMEYEAMLKENKARYEKYNFKPGMKVWFAGESRSYTIRCCSERYLVCTKPYNFKKNTVIYTMVDLWEGIRGRDGYSIGAYDYYEQEDCEKYLQELVNGEINISHRHYEPLSIYKTK